MPKTKSKRLKAERQPRTAKRTRSGKTDLWEATRFDDYDMVDHDYRDEEDWS